LGIERHIPLVSKSKQHLLEEITKLRSF